MGYIPPARNDLKKSLAVINQQYTNGNVSRIQRIQLLNILDNFLDQIAESESTLSDHERDEIYLGAMVLSKQSIEATYKILDPEYKPGWFGGSLGSHGSTLLKLINQALAISDANKLDNKQQLIYLNKFYNFFVKNELFICNDETLDIQKVLSENAINVAELREQIRQALILKLSMLNDEIEKILHATPTGKATHYHLSNLNDAYHTQDDQSKPWFGTAEYNNTKREFQIQLGEAISNILQPKVKANVTDVEMSTEQAVEMGAALHFMQSIRNEGQYIFLSPSRSRLFNRCQHLLNINDFADMSPAKMLECLCAYKKFLQNESNVQAIKDFGPAQYGEQNRLKNIYSNVDNIQQEIDEMIKEVKAGTLNAWTLSSYVGAVVGVLAGFLGYGLGTVIGEVAGETDYTLGSKRVLANLFNSFATTYVARSAGYLGFLISDRTVQFTLERAFGKALEQLFMLMGFTAVAVGSYIAISASVAAYQVLVAGVREALGKLSPEELKAFDMDFVECLCTLNPEVFDPKNQLKIRSITDPESHSALKLKERSCSM